MLVTDHHGHGKLATYEVGDLHLALAVSWPSRHSLVALQRLLLSALLHLAHAASRNDGGLGTWTWTTRAAGRLATVAHDLVERLAKLVRHFGVLVIVREVRLKIW